MAIEDADRIGRIGRRDQLTPDAMDGLEMARGDESGDTDERKSRHGFLKDALRHEDEIAGAERDVVGSAARDAGDRDDDTPHAIALSPGEYDLAGVGDGRKSDRERDGLTAGHHRGERKRPRTRNGANHAHPLGSELFDEHTHLRPP